MIKYEYLYLYSKIKANNRFKLKFTFLKFGDPREVVYFGNRLIKKINKIDNLKRFAKNFFITVPPSILGCTAVNLIRDYLCNKIGCPAALIAKQRPYKYYALINSRQARKKIIDRTMRLIKPKFLHNKKAILIDDVLASGSTLKEVIRVLTNAGAKDIYVYALLKINNKNLSVEGKIYDIALARNIKRIKYLLNKRVITSQLLKNFIRLNNLAPAKFKKIMHKINKNDQKFLISRINQYDSPDTYPGSRASRRA